MKRRESMISTTLFNYTKSDLVLLFLISLTLIIFFTVLIALPARLVIGLLISFFIFYRRDDDILKLGEILRIRIVKLIYNLMADVKPNPA